MADTVIPPPAEAKVERERGPKLRARFVLRLDDTTYDVLRDFAHKRHVPMNAVIREALRSYLKDRL